MYYQPGEQLISWFGPVNDTEKRGLFIMQIHFLAEITNIIIITSSWLDCMCIMSNNAVVVGVPQISKYKISMNLCLFWWKIPSSSTVKLPASNKPTAVMNEPKKMGNFQCHLRYWPKRPLLTNDHDDVVNKIIIIIWSTFARWTYNIYVLGIQQNSRFVYEKYKLLHRNMGIQFEWRRH